MYYLILAVGGLLLVLNFRYRQLLEKSVSQTGSNSFRQFMPVAYFISLVNEWKLYALGDRTLRGQKGLYISLGILMGMMLVNYNWLQFDWLIFISVLLVVLFIGQVRIGRMLHHKYFEDGFPEVLSVINAAVSAGHSIHQALHRCGQGVEGEMGVLFNKIDRRLNLGEDPERVFNDARKLYPYREFYFFSVVMLVSLQRGGQLRLLISRLSRIINNSKTLGRRKKAMTSEARASAKIVAAIPILFFFGMKYLSPENYNFVVHDPVGKLILYYVIGSELTGMLIIWFLLRRAT